MKTSVAMTTYNGSKYILDLLDSIRMQDEAPDEVVIIDDHSTDETYELVEAYIDKYNLMTWQNIRNEENIGWKLNFRKAIKKCTGDIIFLCDQDDIWKSFKIREMKEIMTGNVNIQLLVTNYAVKDEGRVEKVRVRGLDCDDGTLESVLFKSNSLTIMRPGCTFCVRRHFLDKLWTNDLVNYPHDAMIWAYAVVYDGLFMLKRKTLEYRRHSDSAAAPEKRLCCSRRIEEVAFDIGLEAFFEEECRKSGFNQKAEIIRAKKQFSQNRKMVLGKKSLWRMILFQIVNYRHYPTLRNMLSDDYVLLVHRQ